jgi:hypothetical protein
MNKITSVMKLEDSFMLEDTFEKLRKPAINEFYPTEASYEFEDGVIGKCRRAVFFDKKGVAKEKLSLRTRHIFEFGHMLEDYMIDKHKSLGIFVAREIPFDFPVKDIIIRGRFDEIVILDGDYVGVEIKSGHGYNFLRQHIMGYKRGPKTKTQLHILKQTQSAPKPEHLLQAGLYLYYAKQLMPLINGTKISSWRLVYRATDSKVGAEYAIFLEENGGMHKIKAYKLYTSSDSEYEDEIEEIILKDIYIEKILERYLSTYEYIKKNIIPPSDFIIDENEKGESEDWQCDYCQFKYLCKQLPQTATDATIIDVAKNNFDSLSIKVS